MGTPAGARARRKALTDQPSNDVRGIEGKFANLDGLVIQFGESATGSAFVDAWFNARKVADLGRRAAKPAPAPAPAVKQPVLATHKIYPAKCEACAGKGRITDAD